MENFFVSTKFFFVCILISCAACSSHQPLVQTNPNSVRSDVTFAAELSVSESFGKTILDFPIDMNAQVYADVKSDNLIEVMFVPSVADFAIPPIQTGIVQSIVKKMDSNNVQSLQISLKSKSKFLLSRQENGIGRLMLVADSIESAIAPVNYITAVDFKIVKNVLQITTYSSFPFELLPQADDSFKLLFSKVQFQSNLVKKYDLSQLAGQSAFVTARNNPNGDAVLVFSGYTNPELSIRRNSDQTLITVRPTSNIAADKPVSAKLNTTSNAVAPVESENSVPELNALYPGMKERYTGEKISIDLQDADVEHVLRLISEISGYNLILDDAITGKISLKLVDIPWDQALDLVLLQKNLGMVLKGNIMRIASTAKLDAERVQMQRAREAALQAQQSMQNLAPLKTEYVQINYNTAAEFEGKLKSMLTSRGNVSSDPRTNILIVTDTEESLNRISSYIKKLDRPERQVMIEARLVYATDEFQRSLGVKWGTTYSAETTTNAANEQWRNSASVSSVGLNTLSTSSGVTLGGTIGKYLGEDLFSLDATLQLGESKNLVKTISSPRVLTLNNNRAEIQQGTKLATASESQSGGTTTQYQDAVLKISVLPQITPDNKLILDLSISDDSPKSDGRDIDTKQTKTKMMVNDRETIVIGGVQKTTDTTGVGQIPGLGDVPGVGWLFKNKYQSKNKAELLIFIQARIL